MSRTVLKMDNITKTFSGVKALDNVFFEVQEGEIHALIGENGAGKSTLMKVLSGVHPFGSYTGDIILNGNICIFKNTNQSEALGIVIIHQELALIPELSIAENIFLGNELLHKGIIDWNQTIIKTTNLLNKVGLKISPQEKVKNIGVGQQQLVEIAKALSKDVKLLILDEPTSALNEEDSGNLLNLLLELKAEGITSVLISHKLKELIKVSDSITILRDGKTIETLSFENDEINENRIIKGMVGRDLSNLFPERKPKIGEIVFEVRNWSAYHPVTPDRKILSDINLHVRKGEIVGIAGLMGAGRTELAMSIYGRSYGKKITGKAFKNGTEIDIKNVEKAIQNGIAYVSENRKEYGLILIDSVKNNITLAGLSKLTKKNIINSNAEVNVAEEIKSKINIKAPTIYQKVMNLSGGNQQKVVLGKWIYTDPDILILDEPTRGIDVGAKFEIYKIINDLTNNGKSIIMISSELPELLGMCDRIYTLADGRITNAINKDEASQEILMKYMTDSWRA